MMKFGPRDLFTSLFTFVKIQINHIEKRKMDREEEKMFLTVRQELLGIAEEDYKKFSGNLIPGEERILGIRIPKLRAVAKSIVKGNWKKYLDEYEQYKQMERKKNGETEGGCYFEEDMLFGMVIGYAKMEITERMEQIRRFLPVISNWSVCDCCCATYKFMKKNQEQWYEFLKEQLASEEEFRIRFALVALLDHFVNAEYIERILEDCEKMKHSGYYAKMAAAWAISVCFVKFPEKTECFLKENQMDDWIQNKAIQKTRESYRVSKEKKEEILNYKRN